MPKRYWLMKTEPAVFSWDDLENSPDETTCWEGVRNYQARNFMRDDVQLGDGVLFYHSREKPMSVVGKCKVVRTSYPDHTQFDPKSNYFDPKSSEENPRWIMVDVKADGKFKYPVTLDAMKANPDLSEMRVVQKGSRLSVTPVTAEEWKTVLAMSRKKS